jgi:hypothetical protein
MERTNSFWSACILFVLTVFAMPMQAQQDYYTISGIVKNGNTGKGLAYVNVLAPKEHVSTVTNAEGRFILKTPQRPKQITISHVGYRTREFTLNDKLENLEIVLQPAVVLLSEIVVSSGDPREILKKAISKIPTNYSNSPELYRGFYRETTQKGRRYIYVGEAVVDMYKTQYTHPISGDRVRIDKARRLISPKESDTLGAKVQGGPTLPIHIDVVKNIDYIFSETEMINYDYKLEDPVLIGDRPQLVISMRPRLTVDYPLYYGKIYIDHNTLAFTRVELELDMSDKDKATRMMLVRKPLGVRFKPREMKLVVDYVLDHGVSRLNYVQSSSVFRCDWKRKLFHSNYHVTAEMVVTHRYPEARVISGRTSFNNRSSLYDKVELFEDPEFWGRDNIIKPTESLLKAIGKLKRILLKDIQ